MISFAWGGFLVGFGIGIAVLVALLLVAAVAAYSRRREVPAPRHDADYVAPKDHVDVKPATSEIWSAEGDEDA